MKKIARVFRDEDTRHIVLSRVDPVSLELAWYNKTMTSRDCPLEQIIEIKRFLMEREGVVRPRIVQAFEPSFHLSDIKVTTTTFQGQLLSSLSSIYPLMPGIEKF